MGSQSKGGNSNAWGENEQDPLIAPRAGPSNYGSRYDEESGGYSTSSSRSDYSDDSSDYCGTGITRQMIAVFACLIIATIAMFYSMRVDELQHELQMVPTVQLSQLALEDMNDKGVLLRVQGTYELDYSVISGTFRRLIVRTGAKVMHSFTVNCSDMDVYLYDMSPSQSLESTGLGDEVVSASFPPVRVIVGKENVPNTFNTVVTLSDFGDSDTMTAIVNKILFTTEPVTFRSVGSIVINKGLLSLGPYPVTYDETISSGDGGDNNGDDDDNDGEKDGPNDPSRARPEFDVTVGNVSMLPGSESNGMDVSTDVHVDVKDAGPLAGFQASIPSLNWELMVAGCDEDKVITVSDGGTAPFEIDFSSSGPRRLDVTVQSGIDQLPPDLITPCAGSNKSPLDKFVGNYLAGADNFVTIRGSKHQDAGLPSWLSSLLRGLSYSFAFAGKQEGDNLINKIEFNGFKVDLFGHGWSRTPRVSAVVTITLNTPEGLTIDRGVDLRAIKVKGDVALFEVENRQKFAYLQLPDWTDCNTTINDDNNYVVQFGIDSVPIQVVNEGVFGSVVRQLMFEGSVPVWVEALVDSMLSTPLGQVTLTDIPIQAQANVQSK
uniref:ARAD1C16764p n=1 Tax=Blastobotrys adeninivorans TaxID=409370 RepID=A0A060T1I5_BLAAD